MAFLPIPSMRCSQWLGAGSILLALALFSQKVEAAKTTLESARPANILLIVVDDESPFDLKRYNPESSLDTPTLDRLAASGMTIDGAYHMGSWSGAVCLPSRHMLMSGRTLWHLPKNGIPGAGANPLCPSDLAENTLAAVFNRAGYDTMRTCKRGNSYGAANAQFTVRREETKRGAKDSDGSAWHADQVLSFLDERAKAEDRDPFLIYLGFSHPHDPRWGKPDLLKKYGASNEKVPEQANPSAPALPIDYLPGHPFPLGHPNLRDEVSVQGVLRRRDEATVRNEIGRQFACVENIDRQIRRVLNQLEAMEELDNTFVIYTSDHGIAIGRHGLMGKQNLYEHTWRVPLLVAGPGIEAGTRAQGNVYLLDFLATLCDLTGIAIPPTSEGISFGPVLRGEQETVRQTLYGAYSGGTKPGLRCVRQGDWKLIKYDVLDGTVHETQLFNLALNPHELLVEHQAQETVDLTGNQPKAEQVNLARDPRYSNRLAAMEALLQGEMARLDDPYRLWDQDEF